MQKPAWIRKNRYVLYKPQERVYRIDGTLDSNIYLSNGGETLTLDWRIAINKDELEESTRHAFDLSQCFDLSSVENDLFRSALGPFSKKIRSIQTIKGRTAENGSFSAKLDPRVKAVIPEYIVPYTHQVDSLNHLLEDRNLLQATNTASGKSLPLHLYMLQLALQGKRSICVFPLKALVKDQYEKIKPMADALGLKVSVLTGDTSQRDRLLAFTPKVSDIIMMSPDFLCAHIGRLANPKWHGWREFMKGLEFVSIDEAHEMIGTAGGNLANTLRRLAIAKRETMLGKSDFPVGKDVMDCLQFAISTATLSNKENFARSLISSNDRTFGIVDKSCAAQADKDVVVFEPVEDQVIAIANLAIASMMYGLNGIVFLDSVNLVKRLQRCIVEILDSQGFPDRSSRFEIFYGSLLEKDRLEILKNFNNGEVSFIIATKALEAGLDLDDLNLVILGSVPNKMGLQQRIGRCGRKVSTPGMAVYVPSAENRGDTYFAQHPEKMLDGKFEQINLNIDYPDIVGRHVQCAVIESVLFLEEVGMVFGPIGERVVEKMLEKGLMALTPHTSGMNKLNITLPPDMPYWKTPHGRVSSSFRGNKIDVFSVEHNGYVIEKMDMDRVLFYATPGLYYYRRYAKKSSWYEVDNLNFKKRIVELRKLPEKPKDTRFPISTLRVNPKTPLKQSQRLDMTVGQMILGLYTGHVTRSVIGYTISGGGKKSTKIDYEEPFSKSFKTAILTIQLTGDAEEYLLGEFRSLINAMLQEEFKSKHDDNLIEILYESTDSQLMAIAYHSMIHALKATYPRLSLGVKQDLGEKYEDEIITNAGITVPSHAIMYDNSDLSNGACSFIFDNFNKMSTASITDIIDICDCHTGCPRCIVHTGCHQKNIVVKQLAKVFFSNIVM